MPQTVMSFKLSVELARLLEEYARKRRMSKSEVVRRAIMEYLRRRGYSRLPPELSPTVKHNPRAVVIEVDV